MTTINPSNCQNSSGLSKAAERMRKKRQQESDEARQSRLEKDRLAKRARKDRLTTEERDQQRRQNVESQAQRRSQLPAEELAQTRQNNAESHATRRAQLTTEERAEQRRVNAEQHASRRSQLPMEELEMIRHLDAADHATRRAQLTTEERAEQRRINAEQQASIRSQLPEEELARIRRNNAASHATQRAQLTTEERAEQRRINAEQHASRRSRRPRITKKALQPVEETDSFFTGALEVSECSNCQALKLKFESKGSCCSDGQVPTFELHRPDDHIISLYRGNDRVSKLFRTKIRWFNNCFSLSAFECNEESRTVTRDGITIFGTSYQRVPSLMVPNGNQPKYCQMYLYDTEAQLDLRLRQTGSIDNVLQRSIFEQLNTYLLSRNCLFPTVKAAYELARDYPSYKIVLEEGTQVTAARRQYSAVRVNELALLFPENAFRQGSIPGILINHRDGSSTRADQYSSVYTAAGYPLLFINGQPGWGRNSVRRDGKRLSLSAWCRNLFFVRRNVFNPIVESLNLSKQFALDMKQRIEWVQHQWYRLNQSSLRVDTASNINDAQSRGADPSSIGRRIILTAASKASPRWFHQRYLNAMEIVAGYGAPSLFITVTCNQAWPEIAELANVDKYSSWSPSDRPDLVARAFHNRLCTILDDIVTKEVFGKVVAHCYSIEWQKRGNPHAHCVFWLSPEDKLDTVAKIDSAISTKIPPPSQPRLRDLVIKHMIHGPCGLRNPRSPCMEVRNGMRVCSKQYPKCFSNETTIGEDCYAHYARPSPENGGQTALKGTHCLDNRDVVPYNPYLLHKYGCHINVEKVCSVKSLHYIFKYTFKGCDMATFKKVQARRDEEDIVDEITNWEEGRYLSVGEAVWDIFEFPRHGNSPPIVQLDLHLPGENTVVIDPETGWDSVDTSRSTKLTAFFKLNQVDEAARMLLYRQIPAYYVYKGKRWVRRLRGPVDEGVMNLKRAESLGRIPFVSPSNRHKNEVFALYLLLCNTRGPKSFIDLRTVDGVVHSTFVDAAVARNLMEDENFLERAILEAKTHLSGYELRRFFAMLLVFWHGQDGKSFYEAHLADLCEDFLSTARRDRPEAILDQSMVDRCLNQISGFLEELGSSLREKNLPQPTSTGTTSRRSLGLSYVFTEEEVSAKYSTLNDQQREVFDTVVPAVSNREGGIFFLNASGGTGKSYLLNVIIAALCARNLRVCPTASSGIASTVLLGGRTIHSAFNVPLKCDCTSVCRINKQSRLGEDIRSLDCIIWDEAPMQSNEVLETLDRSFRDIRGSPDEPFGGITMLLAGDWRQILPVVKNGTRASIVASTHKRSHLWDRVRTLSLSANMRVSGSDEAAVSFRNFVLAVGDGSANVSENGVSTSKVRLTESMLLESPSPSALCDFVFDEFAEMFASSEEDYAQWICSRAVLCTNNEQVDAINLLMHNRMPGREFINLSIDTQLLNVESGGAPEVQTHHLNFFKPSGVPPHELKIKVGSPVMLMRNIAPASGHCNGSKYVVVSCGTHILKLRAISGPAKGQIIPLPRLKFITSVQETPIQFSRVQFPVRPAFALTVHKAQGQSLERVGVSLLEDAFTHGQLYVALSRPTSPQGIKVIRPWDDNLGHCDGCTQNVVYPEILG